MRSLILFVIISISFWGCFPSKELTKDQTEKIFAHNVNLKKEEIKQKLILFANEKFVSGKAVIQSNEDGFLAGNGIVQIHYHSDLLGENINRVKMEFTFMVKYADNNYKVKWVVKDLTNDKGSINQNLWGYYADEIEKSITNNDSEMFAYVTGKDDNF